ncbi:hypothetical protein [Virgibacillus sp. DJP39]|uniref:hypothetical protein n=1 Tax=Virgibacillus sp. DJP39 TaxID=3409790 RepID=UPI003BB50F4F
MRLSLLGVSISLFGIAWISASSGSSVSFGLGISFVGLLISLVSCFVGELKKVNLLK